VLLLVAKSTISQINPIIGINKMSCIHPLLPISWSLLAPRANEGTMTAKLYTPLTIPYVSQANAERTLIIILTIQLNKKKYQYSVRVARPLKVAYFCNAKR
jgi:hypothetical protein